VSKSLSTGTLNSKSYSVSFASLITQNFDLANQWVKPSE
jgi:hypothetical protein